MDDFQDEMQSEALHDATPGASNRSQLRVGYGDPTVFAMETEVQLIKQEQEREYQQRLEDYAS